MRIRIVVADQAEARFYDCMGFAGPLVPAGTFLNAAGRARERDLVSDRPGRIFGQNADARRRRGATVRHSSGPEHTARRHAVELFARRIGMELDRARRARRYDAVVLVAGAALLGKLRAALPAAVREKVAATVVKDIVHHPAVDVMAYLPRDIFTGKLRFESAPRSAPRAFG